MKMLPCILIHQNGVTTNRFMKLISGNLPKKEISRKEIISKLNKEKTDFSIPTLDRTLKSLVAQEKLLSLEKGVYSKK